MQVNRGVWGGTPHSCRAQAGGCLVAAPATEQPGRSIEGNPYGRFPGNPQAGGCTSRAYVTRAKSLIYEKNTTKTVGVSQ
jgi:hypothetical protein